MAYKGNSFDLLRGCCSGKLILWYSEISLEPQKYVFKMNHITVIKCEMSLKQTGFFCKAPGQSAPFGPCTAGHFCLSGAVSPTPEDGVTGDRCHPGHYCPVGSSFPLPCPPGHFSNSTKNTELSACLPCPAGESTKQPKMKNKPSIGLLKIDRSERCINVISDILYTITCTASLYLSIHICILSCRICMFQQGALCSFSRLPCWLLLPTRPELQSACSIYVFTWPYVPPRQCYGDVLSSWELSKSAHTG